MNIGVNQDILRYAYGYAGVIEDNIRQVFGDEGERHIKRTIAAFMFLKGMAGEKASIVAYLKSKKTNGVEVLSVDGLIGEVESGELFNLDLVPDLTLDASLKEDNSCK